MSRLAAIVGRLLLALIFIVSGAQVLFDPSMVQTTMASVGLPPILAIPVGLVQLIAGLCLAAGVLVRLMSVVLAVFCCSTILFFHHRIDDPVQVAGLLRDLALIGGLALAFACSHMWHRYAEMEIARREERAARDAQLQAHEAELRAVRAEAAAQAAERINAARATAAYSGDGTVVSDEPHVVHTSHHLGQHLDRGERTVVTDVDGDGVPEVRRRRRWLDW